MLRLAGSAFFLKLSCVLFELETFSQEHAVDDLFSLLAEAPGGHHLGVYVSFFEIYGGRCQDLLNHRSVVSSDLLMLLRVASNVWCALGMWLQ